MNTVNPKKILGSFALAMIAIAAMIDLRGSSMMATYGLSGVFYYSMAALLFLIPSGLVCAELSTNVAKPGGMYAWIVEAFGEKTGFFSMWLEWLNNVIGFPASLSFVAVALTYLVNPAWVQNKFLIFSLTLGILWLITIFTLRGIKASSRLNMLGAIVGIIMPALIIFALAITWIAVGKNLQIDFAWKNLLPDMKGSNPGLFAAIILGFGGIQIVAFHRTDVINPRRNYPRAIFFAISAVFAIALMSALSVATVVPHDKLNLISGFIEGFSRFFRAFDLPWATPIIIIMIVTGLLATFNAWFLGPARGLAVAAEKGLIPTYFAKLNQKNVPVNILMTQAIACTLFSIIFLTMPDVNTGFWILLNLSSQSALLVYILIFAAAIKLRYQAQESPAGYRVPGGKIGIWVVAGTGILTCAMALITSVIPPAIVETGSLWRYEGILFGSNLLFLGIPLVILLTVGYLRRKREIGFT
jgi:amino acid transporter